MSRRKLVKSDIAEAQEKYSGDNAKIVNIELEDETLLFHYKSSDGETAKFTLILGDYPRDCILYTEGKDDPDFVNGPLLKIFQKICQARDNDVTTLSQSGTVFANLGQSDQFTSSMQSDLSDDWRGTSSTDAWGAPVDRDWKLIPKLAHDINRHISMYGADSVQIQHMPLLEQFDCTILIDIRECLSLTTASAWGIDATLPLHVNLQLSDSYADSTTPPKFELYQRVAGAKQTFRLKFQLENILVPFMRIYWQKFVEQSPELVVPHGGVGHEPDEKPQQHAQGDKDDDAEPVSAEGLHGISARLGNLLEMGFEGDAAETAAQYAPSVEIAVRWLTDESLGNKKPTTESVLEHVAKAGLLHTPAPKPAPASSSSSSSRHKHKHKHKHKSNKKEDLEDFLLIGKDKDMDQPGYHHGSPIDGRNGFLVMLNQYIRGRIPSCHDFCVICDQPHVFAHGTMLKPSVCSRELCVWSFQQLGVGSDAADDIATSSTLIELLIRLAQAASKSSRSQVIFEPYPLLFHPKNRDKIEFNPKSKDFKKLGDVLAKFPQMSELASRNDIGEIKTLMDTKHELAFPLMQWLISSNRCHMVRIEAQHQLPCMGTVHQFLMLSAAPEHEAKFRALRKKHGSTFAFHGSATENWHSILRTGLRNASGTKFQVNGAAYGSGIYLSPAAATSLGYCRHTGTFRQGSGKNGWLGPELVCMAMCEVINHDIKKSGDIWVQPHETHVVTRFFFVFDNATARNKAQAVHTQNNKNVLTEINKPLKFYGLDQT